MPVESVVSARCYDVSGKCVAIGADGAALLSICGRYLLEHR